MIFLKIIQQISRQFTSKQYPTIALCLTLISLPLPSLAMPKHTLFSFDFAKQVDFDCSNAPTHCYTLENLVHKGIEGGLDCRQAIQMLYVARQTVRTKMGLILPQVSVYQWATFGTSSTVSLDTVLPFVGFLFPNRWYDWKSSRFLRDAQIESVATVFANKTQSILDLYFNIQSQIWTINFLEFYIYEIERLVAFLNTQKVNGYRRATEEDIGILENIRGKLIYQRAFVDLLAASHQQLASILGLSPDVDWSTMRLEPYQMSFLEREKFGKYLDYWPDAISRSTEVKNMKHLISSAERNKRSVYFDFIDPSSGNNLGFGYGSRIKIARANIEILELQLQQTNRQVSNAVQDSLNNYNDAVRSFPGIIGAIKSLVDIQDAVETNINNTSAPLDITALQRYFEYSTNQGSLYISSFFMFKIAEADLNRYTWRGPFYEIVLFYREHRIKRFLKEVKKQHSHHKALEHKVSDLYRHLKPRSRQSKQ